jgi:hypothetical protein
VVSAFAVHGSARSDPQEVAAHNAGEQRKASITSKEQISQWRNTKK